MALNDAAREQREREGKWDGDVNDRREDEA